LGGDIGRQGRLPPTLAWRLGLGPALGLVALPGGGVVLGSGPADVALARLVHRPAPGGRRRRLVLALHGAGALTSDLAPTLRTLGIEPLPDLAYRVRLARCVSRRIARRFAGGIPVRLRAPSIGRRRGHDLIVPVPRSAE